MNANRRALLLLVVLGVLPWLSPHDPVHQYREYASHAPGCAQYCFLLGTDSLGRDVLSRLLTGARFTLLVAITAATVATVVGALLGALAGFFGRWVDFLLSRCVAALLAVPWIYLVLAVRAALPLSIPGERAFLAAMALLGLFGLGAPFLQARTVVASGRLSGSVLAAEGLGAAPTHILRHHLLPQAMPVLIAVWITLVPTFVVAEVSLTFLGLGAGEPTVTWGTLLAQLQQYPTLIDQWWMFSPVAVLALLLALLPRWRSTASGF